MASSFEYARSLPSTFSAMNLSQETQCGMGESDKQDGNTAQPFGFLKLLALSSHLIALGGPSSNLKEGSFMHLGPDYDYAALRAIGHGATFAVKRYVFKEVHFGRNGETLHQYGALKRVRPSSPMSRSSQLDAVTIELRSLLLPRLRDHDNIVTCLGLGWEEDREELDIFWPVILLEYADLGDLASYQERRLVLRYETKKNLCLDVGLGLMALHDYGICHGDLKSENTLLFSHPRRDTDKPGARKLIGGTPPYNAPECSRKVPSELLKFTDVYSYGLLIWRTMIDGNNPFDGIIDSYHPEYHTELQSLDFFLSRTTRPQMSNKDKIAHMKEHSDLTFWAQLALVSRPKLVGRSNIDNFLHEIMGALQATLSREPVERVLAFALMSLKVSPEEWKKQGRSHHYSKGGLSGFEPYDKGFLLETDKTKDDRETFQPQLWDIERSSPYLALPAIQKQVIKDLVKLASGTWSDLSDQSKCHRKLFECHLLGLGSHVQPNFQEAERWLSKSSDIIRGEYTPNDGEIVRQQLMPMYQVRDALSLNPTDLTPERIEQVTSCAVLGSTLAWTFLKHNDPEYKTKLELFRCGYGGFQPKLECPYNNIKDYKEDERMREEMHLSFRSTAACKKDRTLIEAGLFNQFSRSGYLNCIRMFVEDFGSDINRQHWDGETPIFEACRAGHANVVRLLVSRGADVTLAADNGETCLHWVVSFDDKYVIEMTRLLVSAGGSLEAVADWNTTLCGRTLDAGFCGGTPLHRAISLKNKTAVIALLKCGADPLAQGFRTMIEFGWTGSEYGMTPPALAAALHLSDILSVLLHSNKTSAKYRHKMSHKSLLYTAIESRVLMPAGRHSIYEQRMILHGGHYRTAMRSTISLLVHYGADINYLYTDIDDYPQSALQEAVLQNDTEMAELLLELYPEKERASIIKARSGQYGFQPLYYAITNGNRDLFTLLLDAGASVTSSVYDLKFHRNKYSGFDTYLHHCTKYREDTFFATALLEHGAEVDYQNFNGETAFQKAVMQNNFLLAETLMSWGADPQAVRAEFGRTLVGDLLSRGHDIPLQQVKWLLDNVRDSLTGQPPFIVNPSECHNIFHIISIFDPGRHADDLGTRAALSLLLSYCDSPSEAEGLLNLDDGYGVTPLHFAVISLNLEAVRILLEHGADAKNMSLLEIGLQHVLSGPTEEVWESGEKAVKRWKEKVDGVLGLLGASLRDGKEGEIFRDNEVELEDLCFFFEFGVLLARFMAGDW